jgi:hypothetical protein
VCETCLPHEVLGGNKNPIAHREEESRWLAQGASHPLRRRHHYVSTTQADECVKLHGRHPKTDLLRRLRARPPPAVFTEGDRAGRRARGCQAGKRAGALLRNCPVDGCPVYRNRCGYPDRGRSHRLPGSSPPSDTNHKSLRFSGSKREPVSETAGRRHGSSSSSRTLTLCARCDAVRLCD